MSTTSSIDAIPTNLVDFYGKRSITGADLRLSKQLSSGGVLSLEAAAYDLMIEKLALYEPPFNAGDDSTRQASDNYTKQLYALLAVGRRGDAVALAMTTFGAPAETVAGMRQTPIWSLFESVAPALAYDNTIMGDGSVPNKLLASVAVPTMVIGGGARPVFMHNAAQATADALPHAERRTLEGQTHDVAPGVLAPRFEKAFRWLKFQLTRKHLLISLITQSKCIATRPFRLSFISFS